MTLARRLAVIVPLVGALWSLAAPAEAARVAPVGKVRVHLDTEVVSWAHGREYRAPFDLPSPFGEPRWTVIGFGAGRPVTADGYPMAGGSVIALGVGYGVHRKLILGARFGMNLSRSYERSDESRGSDPWSATAFVGTFTPYLELLPIDEGRVLPYFLIRSGFAGGVLKGDDGTNMRAMAPLVGAGLGAHAFVAPHFSIDFGLTFDYRWVRIRGGAGLDAPDDVYLESWGPSQQFILAGTLGLSTWFGGPVDAKTARRASRISP